MVSLTRKVVGASTAIVCSCLVMAPVGAQNYGYTPYNGSSAGSSGASGYGGGGTVYNGTPAGNTPNPQYAYNGSPTYRGHAVFIPAGMVMPITLNTSIDTSVAKAGDLIQGTLTQELMLGNAVIPAGSVISGNVVNAKAGGFLTRSGLLDVKFNRLRVAGGADIPISSHIVGGIGKYTQVGGDQSGTVRGEQWTAKAGQTLIRGGVGAGLGAALGTAVGAIAGHGRGAGAGAWSGAAIGGGLGVADGLILRKGRDVKLQSGLPLQVQLDAPVSMNGPSYGAF